MATSLYNNTGVVFLCCLVRAQVIQESRIPKLRAVGVQKNSKSTSYTTESTTEMAVKDGKLVVEREVEVSL
jgi:hypothetical protein